MVADALSRKSVSLAASELTSCAELIRDFERLELEVFSSVSGGGDAGFLAQLSVEVSLQDRIREAQRSDTEYQRFVNLVRAKKRPDLVVDDRSQSQKY